MSQHIEKPEIASLQTPPQWVVDMHAYFVKTGSYRTEDVQRVLGDPRDYVGGNSADDHWSSCTRNRFAAHVDKEKG